MSLTNLQTDIAEAILAQETDILDIEPASNLQIYANNVRANHYHALEDCYPLIMRLLGADLFRATAKEYIKRYPSRSSNLHDYGEYFGDFLAEYEPMQELVYIAEVARFEWACHLIYFASDHAPLNIGLLGLVAPEQYDQLHFSLHPASHLIKVNYPLLRIIDLCKGKINNTINIHEGGANLLILRRNFEILLLPLNDAEYAFLTSLSNNETLAESLAAALKLDTHFQLDKALPRFIKEQVIVDFNLKQELSIDNTFTIPIPPNKPTSPEQMDVLIHVTQ